MRTNLSKKLLAALLSLAMVLSLVGIQPASANAASYSITKNVSVTAGKSTTLKVKGVKSTQYVKVWFNKDKVSVKNGSTKLTNAKTKVKGTGKTLSLKVTTKELNANYGFKVTVKVYNKKTNKVAKTLVSNNNKVKTTYVAPEEQPTEETLAVTGVAVANATTLTISGTKLGDLTVADITAEGLTLVNYVAAEDGKTATIEVSGGLTAEKEYKIVISGKEFTVKYIIPELTSVTIDNQQVDWFTNDQVVEIKVNGAVTTVDELIKQGYTVEFVATDYDVNGTKKLFGASGKSTTGKVYYDGASALGIGDVYKVAVTLTKDGKSTTSNSAKITVVNKNLGTHAILGVYFTNDQNTDYKLGHSNVLVYDPAGTYTETDTIVGMDIMINNKEAELNAAGVTTAITSGLLKITSSNEAVVSVDAANLALKAESCGTATITFEYGTAKETIVYTVKNYNTDAREAKKVISADSYTTAHTFNYSDPTALTSVGYVILDQYGDVMKSVSGVTVTGDITNLTLGAVTNPTTGYNGSVAVTVADAFKGIVQFKVDGVSIGYLSLTMTKNNVSTWKLVQKSPSSYTHAANGEGYYEISADSTLDMYRDSAALFKIIPVDAKGNEVDDGTPADTNDFTITSASTALSVAGDGVADEWFTVNATKVTAGFVSIKVDEKATSWTTTVNLKVADTRPVITGVKFNSVSDITAVGVTFGIGDVLALKGKDTNPEIDVTTSVSLTGKIRLADDGKIYLDSNANGSYDVSDLLLGNVKAVATSNSVPRITGAATTLSANVLTQSFTTQSKDAGTLNIVVSSGNSTFTTTVKFDVD